MTRAAQTATHVPIGRLTAHPANIRTDLGDLTELAVSIREHGIIQPLTATELDDDSGRLLLLDGHRRLGAAMLCREITQVPVIIRHQVTDPTEQLAIMLVTATHNRGLNPMEKADGYGALRNHGLTVPEIARKVGVSQPTVYYYLSLLELPEAERNALRRGRITAAAAIAEVRDAREEQRRKERPTGGTVGRPKGATTKPWFGADHPLATVVRRSCDHRGRKKVGGIGCGPCWEQAILDAAGTGGGIVQPDHHDIDEAVVQRVLDGHWKTPCNPAEKQEVVRRWHASGRHLNDLARKTGWKPERYFQAIEVVA